MRHFLLLLLLFSCSHSLAFAVPPNFLLIIADDFTDRDLRVYGGQAKRPHFDKLAGEGLRLSHCFQAAPMCSPTRHNLYTGLCPVKSGAHCKMRATQTRGVASIEVDVNPDGVLFLRCE